MAIDGVGIIDSDFAYDVYNIIMEMYHRGESIENIRNKIDGFHPTCCDIDYEIFNTAYGLAMWEIGELTDEQLHDIKDIVLKGTSSQWNEVYPNAQKARQRILNNFLQKIEQPNLKIKRRKMYKKITNALFSKGDILAVNINNRYRCLIFQNFYQYRNDAYYSFVVTTYSSEVEPTAESLLLEEIPVTKKTIAGFGIRVLNVYYKIIEEHKSSFLKSGIVCLDPQAEELGFSRQVSGVKDLYDMEKEMDDILLGEKTELYECCLF